MFWVNHQPSCGACGLVDELFIVHSLSAANHISTMPGCSSKSCMQLVWLLRMIRGGGGGFATAANTTTTTTTPQMCLCSYVLYINITCYRNSVWQHLCIITGIPTLTVVYYLLVNVGPSSARLF